MLMCSSAHSHSLSVHLSEPRSEAATGSQCSFSRCLICQQTDPCMFRQVFLFPLHLKHKAHVNMCVSHACFLPVMFGFSVVQAGSTLSFSEELHRTWGCCLLCERGGGGDREIQSKCWIVGQWETGGWGGCGERRDLWGTCDMWCVQWSIQIVAAANGVQVLFRQHWFPSCSESRCSSTLHCFFLARWWLQSSGWMLEVFSREKMFSWLNDMCPPHCVQYFQMHFLLCDGRTAAQILHFTVFCHCRHFLCDIWDLQLEYQTQGSFTDRTREIRALWQTSSGCISLRLHSECDRPVHDKVISLFPLVLANVVPGHMQTLQTLFYSNNSH